jgi:hypothetical protein
VVGKRLVLGLGFCNVGGQTPEETLCHGLHDLKEEEEEEKENEKKLLRDCININLNEKYFRQSHKI